MMMLCHKMGMRARCLIPRTMFLSAAAAFFMIVVMAMVIMVFLSAAAAFFMIMVMCMVIMVFLSAAAAFFMIVVMSMVIMVFLSAAAAFFMIVVMAMVIMVFLSAAFFMIVVMYAFMMSMLMFMVLFMVVHDNALLVSFLQPGITGQQPLFRSSCFCLFISPGLCQGFQSVEVGLLIIYLDQGTQIFIIIGIHVNSGSQCILIVVFPGVL